MNSVAFSGLLTLSPPRQGPSQQSQLLDTEPSVLTSRLRLQRGEPFDPIPTQLLRKYVGYARKYVHPSLSDDAKEVLQKVRVGVLGCACVFHSTMTPCAFSPKFYLELRTKHQGIDSTPITTRQIESLIRLAEARARMELREVVTEQDAKDVLEVMRMSLFDT